LKLETGKGNQDAANVWTSGAAVLPPYTGWGGKIILDNAYCGSILNYKCSSMRIGGQKVPRLEAKYSWKNRTL